MHDQTTYQQVNDQTNYQQVKDAFSRFGRIFVKKTRKWHRKSKFGFVRFFFEKDAEVAMRNLNGKLLNGVPIVVSMALYPQDPH